MSELRDQIPPAPRDLPLPDRLAWRAGYLQALEDLIALELDGGEVLVDGQVVYSRELDAAQ